MSIRPRAIAIPLVFFLCGTLGIALLYRVIESSGEERLRLEVGITAEQVRLRLEAWVDSRTTLVIHLGDREIPDAKSLAADFGKQAQAFIDMYPGIQALNFIDRDWILRQVVPAESNAPALGKDLHKHPSPGVIRGLERASQRQQVTSTPIIDLLQGGKGIATYYPLVDQSGNWLGFVNGVFRVRELIDTCLYENVLRERFDYWLVDEGGAIAYGKIPASGPDRFEVAVPVRIVDREWTLHMAPNQQYVAQAGTAADEIMAGTGVLSLALLALLLRLLLLRQEALRESQDKYRLLVENQIDMVVKLDPQGHFLYASPSYCRAFGRTEEELLGTSFLPLVHPDDRQEARTALAELRQPPHQSHAEHRSLTRSGIAWQSWTNAAVLDESGQVAAITSVGRDITRRRQLEDQLNLSRKMQAVGQLAGGIAHDFNNILQTMLGNLQFIIQDLRPTGQSANDLQEINRGITKAMALTRQLLAFGRRQELRAQPEDLNEIVESALTQWRRDLRSAINLVLEPAGHPLTVRVDRGQAEQIVLNLCDNARDAIATAGTITVSTSTRQIDDDFCRLHPELTPGEYAQLEVVDDGEGMDPEVLERAFEPFYTTREVGAGSGLGLATSFGIVQQHRGTVLAESTKGEGSRLIVLLPLDKAAGTPKSQASPPPATPRHETILLAEDDFSVRELAVRVLERAEYKVLVAKDGEEAIAVFAEHQEAIDLVILDMIMPRANGREACEAITGMQPKVPILFASGYDPATMAAECDLPAGTDILLKPYGIPDLLQKVRELLDREPLTH